VDDNCTRECKSDCPIKVFAQIREPAQFLVELPSKHMTIYMHENLYSFIILMFIVNTNKLYSYVLSVLLLALVVEICTASS
jgi:hypothetical protein